MAAGTTSTFHAESFWWWWPKSEADCRGSRRNPYESCQTTTLLKCYQCAATSPNVTGFTIYEPLSFDFEYHSSSSAVCSFGKAPANTESLQYLREPRNRWVIINTPVDDHTSPEQMMDWTIDLFFISSCSFGLLTFVQNYFSSYTQDMHLCSLSVDFCSS